MDQLNHSNRALKVLSSVMGFISSLYGLEHGIFEILQGNTVPESPLIDAIGPANEFFSGAMEPALTIIPNFLIAGILTVILGILGIVWSIAFIRKRYGSLGMLIISVLLVLIGGGSPPMTIGIISSILATRINKPLNWWDRHLSTKTQESLSKVWPWGLVIWLVVSLFSVELAIFGWPFAFLLELDAFFILLNIMGFISDIPLAFSIINAIGYDLNNKTLKMAQNNQ